LTGPGGGTGYLATSTSSLAIGTGSKTFTTQTNLAYSPGARVRASSNGSPTNWMEGAVTSYSSGTTTLVLNIDKVSGSGTFADWNINLAGQPGVDGATGATGPAGAAGPAGDLSAPLGGLLKFVSATQLQFAPFRGDRIKINSVIYPIPQAGIAGLTNTNCFLNGVAAQSLAPNKVYFLYCFNNSGVLTADFSTTGHATSSLAGNAGIEIKSGDDTRSLIGLICTDGNTPGRFFDAPNGRLVRSWINRQAAQLSTNLSSTTSATALTTIMSFSYVAFLNEVLEVIFNGNLYNSNQAINSVAIQVDGVRVVPASSVTNYANWYCAPTAAASVLNSNDTVKHLIEGQMSGDSGTIHFVYGLSGRVG
jgi:hypothetical protein